MTQTTWEKASAEAKPGSRVRLKPIIAGVAILGAVAYLILSSTLSGARYFITVSDLLTSSKYAGQTVRITGAVIGDTINYDTEKLIIEFTIADFAQDNPDLALALHNAVGDSKAARLKVRVENQVKPDLLRDEAQAILTGKLGSDGVFLATELLLKCPSRYEESDPNAAIPAAEKK
jgi:cytochrome c-type biogenesis protein CcmE